MITLTLPPSPGPTWFLGVLLVFSLPCAVIRTIWPGHVTDRWPPRAWHMVTAAGTVAVASYLLRLVVPMDEERWHVAIAPAPAWTVGFVLGLMAGERRWLQRRDSCSWQVISRWSTVDRRCPRSTFTAMAGTSTWTG